MWITLVIHLIPFFSEHIVFYSSDKQKLGPKCKAQRKNVDNNNKINEQITPNKRTWNRLLCNHIHENENALNVLVVVDLSMSFISKGPTPAVCILYIYLQYWCVLVHSFHRKWVLYVFDMCCRCCRCCSFNISIDIPSIPFLWQLMNDAVWSNCRWYKRSQSNKLLN